MAGNFWDNDQVVQPQAQAGGGIPIGSPDPTYGLKLPTAQAALAEKQGDNALIPGKLTAQQIENQTKQLALKAAQDKADAAAKAHDPLVKSTTDALSLASMGNSIQSAISDVDKGHSAGNFFGTEGFQGVPWLGQNSADLAGALSTVKSKVFLDRLQQMKDSSPNGSTGLGRITNLEATMIGNGMGAITQTQSPDVLKTNLANILQHELRLQAASNGENPDDPAIAKKYNILTGPPPGLGGGNAPPPNMPGGGLGGVGGPTPPPAPPSAPNGTPGNGSQLSLSNNGMQTVADPTRLGVNDHVRALIGANHTAPEIVAYLNQISPGLGDQRASDIASAVSFRGQNPSVAMSKYPISLQDNQIPLSPIRSAVNTAAQSSVGAGVLGAADAVTGGYLDNMTSNPALARAGMSAVASAHPYANLAGQVGGGALAAAGMQGGLGLAGLEGIGATRAADAGYGALYGSGTSDDNRLGGAIAGGTVGSLGGMFGRKLTGAVGGALTGVQDAGKQYLQQAGIPTTIGGALGGGVKDIEDRLTSVPLVGSLIKGRQQAGYRGVQKSAFDQALAPIGASTNGVIGESGVASGLDAVGDAYKTALAGKSVSVDPTYAQNMGLTPHPTGGPTVPGMIASIPNADISKEVGAGVKDIISPMFNKGNLSGNDFQAIDRGLEKFKSGYANHPLYNQYIKPAIDAAGDQVEGLWDRQNPDTLDSYNAAKAAYRKMSVLADATNKGINTGGEFTPAQLGLADRSNTIRFGGRNAAASGDRSFTDLQRAAQDNLPSKLPTSGTAERAALPVLAGALGAGGGYHEGGDEHRTSGAGIGAAAGMAALGLAGGAAYSKPMQAMLTQAILAQRPAVMTDAGQAILNRARLGGMFGSQAALQRYIAPGQ